MVLLAVVTSINYVLTQLTTVLRAPYVYGKLHVYCVEWCRV